MGSKDDEKGRAGFTGETFLTERYRVPEIDLRAFNPDANVLQLVSEDFCRLHDLIPVSRDGDKVIVAMVRPGDSAAREAFRDATGYTADPVVATEPAIRQAIAKHYRTR